MPPCSTARKIFLCDPCLLNSFSLSVFALDSEVLGAATGREWEGSTLQLHTWSHHNYGIEQLINSWTQVRRG